MDSLSEPSRSSTGSVNGTRTTFWYDAASSSLSWRCSPPGTAAIASAAVIAVLRNDGTGDSGDGGEYSVLHIETGAFKSTLLADPPQAFISAHPPLQRTPPPHLSCSPESQPNIHIVVSTLSGTGNASSFYTTAVSPTLLALQIPKTAVAVHTTTSAETIIELAHTIFLPRARAGHRQTIILLSGDGGILDLINVLHPSACNSSNYISPTICLLPLGSGNALVNSLLPSTDLTSGLSTLVHGHAHPLPIFKARFSPGSRLLVSEAQRSEPLPDPNGDGEGTIYGAVVFSWGLHATLIADSDTVAYRKFGAERFLMAGKAALFPAEGEPHRYRAKITLFKRPPPGLQGDNEDEDTPTTTATPLPTNEHSYILTTLVSQLEKGFTISPASRALDGRLRLVWFGPLSGEGSMRIIDLAYAGGKHVDEEVVRYEEVEGLRIEFEEEDGRWRRVCVDGKIVMVEEGGWAEVRRDRSSTIDVLVDAKNISSE